MQQQNKNEIACFTVPKIGEAELDIQDAYRYSFDGNLIALSDGASTSFLPKHWAKLLVDYFCDYPQCPPQQICQNWQKWLEPLQQKWAKEAIQFRQIQSERQKQDQSFNVFAGGSSFKDHGAATFIGLNFGSPNEFRRDSWRAIAVGDSCLFHIKIVNNKIKFKSFPYTHSSDFSSVTDCFHSLPEYNSSYPTFYEGLYELGDFFLLATDALAEWILKDREDNSTRWTKLLFISTEDEFSNFIQQLRRDKLIKDDDTTLCRVKILSIPENERTISPLSLPSSSSQHRQQNPQSPQNFLDTERSNQNSGAALSSNKRNQLLRILQSKKSQILIVLFLLAVIIPLAISVFSPINPLVMREQQGNSDNQRTSDSKLIPIYTLTNSFDKQIGYLMRQPLGVETNAQLLVHVPRAYLSQVDNSNFILQIPDTQSFPLYEYKNSPGELLPQDFIGYLLPGSFLVREPKDSYTFKDARWVKIQVRVGN